MLSNQWCRPVVLAGVMAFCLAAMPGAAGRVVAQDQPQWSVTARIPGYDQSTLTPYLVPDEGGVHVFASDLLADDEPDDGYALRAIVYRQWRLADGWTEPNDILLPPLKLEARMQGALRDEDGTLHIVFYAGDENEANFYHSSAPAQEADRAPAWSVPHVVGPDANINDDAVLLRDGAGRLVLIYSGTLEGNGVYVTSSSDGGENWLPPESLYLTYDETLTPYHLNAIVDAQGHMHLVWVVNNITGNTDSLYYARLDAGTDEWTAPVELEQLGGIPAGEPGIIEYDDELFLIYHTYDPGDNGPPGVTRTMRRSRDGGVTWSDRVRLFEHVGSNGPPSLLIDHDNVLHLFFGGRVTRDNEIVVGMWHSIWRGGQWTAPEPIAVNPQTQEDRGSSFPRAVVTDDGVILLATMADPGRIRQGTGGAWYAYLAAPGMVPAATPAPASTATAGGLPTPTAAPATPTAVVSQASPTPALPAIPLAAGAAPVMVDNSPGRLLLLGLGPTLFLIVILVVARQTLRRR